MKQTNLLGNSQWVFFNFISLLFLSPVVGQFDIFVEIQMKSGRAQWISCSEKAREQQRETIPQMLPIVVTREGEKHEVLFQASEHPVVSKELNS